MFGFDPRFPSTYAPFSHVPGHPHGHFAHAHTPGFGTGYGSGFGFGPTNAWGSTYGYAPTATGWGTAYGYAPTTTGFGVGYAPTPAWGTAHGYVPATSYNLPHGIGQSPVTSFGAGFAPVNTTGFSPTTAWNTVPNLNAALTSAECLHLLSRIEEVRAQVIANSELLRIEIARKGMMETAAHIQTHAHHAHTPYPYGVIPFRTEAGMTQTESPVRLRESDSHIYCDLFFPNLSIGDVEVEVIGNRIVCRTRVPVMTRWGTWTAHMATQGTAHMPRGFEFFELPDGRVECSWLSHVPFQTKDVEATFRDGYLCLCITKTEVATPRQSIKIAKDTTGRRAVNEMNS